MEGTARQIALIGQPNVGKSSLFTRLTGVGVICSNYPGTTVEFEEATVTHNGQEIHFHDLPGTYSLSTNSPDEDVVINMLLDRQNDAVILVADAMNLEPGIGLCFELMELGVPIIMAVNRMDLAERFKHIDIAQLSEILQIPVVPVSAKTGSGIEALLDCVTDTSPLPSDFQVRYDGHIVDYTNRLKNSLPVTRLPKWGLSIKLLEGVKQFSELVSEEDREFVKELQEDFRSKHDDTIDVHIARDRFINASEVVYRTVTQTVREKTLAEKVSDITVNPVTGFPILAGVMLGMLAVIVYLGQWLSVVVEDGYRALVGDFIINIGVSIGGTFWESVFAGIDSSFLAILTLVIPYIMVFYIMLGVLEDTGYLPRVVVLLDRIMHRFGLHGGSFIPMMVGLGCNVPAIMATRSLSSRRERLIISSIIIMAVPCSAQIAIIIGITGAYAGMVYAAVIALTLIVIGVAVGLVLNRFLPSEPSNLAMEIPDLTWPTARNVLYKVWARTKDFFSVAVPLLIVGSIVVEIMLNYDLLDPIVEPMSWLTVGMLGLPAVTIIAFLVGILRKEMAYGMLLILLGEPLTAFMTPDQFVVFGVVMAIYMPCLATIATMAKEMGWKDTILISCVSITVAVLTGSLFNFALGFF